MPLTYFVISLKDGLDANETVIKHIRYSSKRAAVKAHNRIPKDLSRLFRIYKIEIPEDSSKVKVSKISHVG